MATHVPDSRRALLCDGHDRGRALEEPARRVPASGMGSAEDRSGRSAHHARLRAVGDGAHSDLLRPLGGVLSRGNRGTDGHQPAGAVCTSRRSYRRRRDVRHHDRCSRQRRRQNPVGMDVRYAWPADDVARHGAAVGPCHARVVRRKRGTGPVLFAGGGCVLVLWHAAVRLCVYDRRLLRHAQPRYELRAAVQRLGSRRHHRTDTRRSRVRHVRRLPVRVLCRRRACACILWIAGAGASAAPAHAGRSSGRGRGCTFDGWRTLARLPEDPRGDLGSCLL